MFGALFPLQRFGSGLRGLHGEKRGVFVGEHFRKQARGLAVARPNVQDRSSRSHPGCIHETGCVLHRAVEVGSGFRFEATVVPHQCGAVSRIELAFNLKQRLRRAFLFVSLSSPAAEQGTERQQLSKRRKEHWHGRSVGRYGTIRFFVRALGLAP